MLIGWSECQTCKKIMHAIVDISLGICQKCRDGDEEGEFSQQELQARTLVAAKLEKLYPDGEVPCQSAVVEVPDGKDKRISTASKDALLSALEVEFPGTVEKLTRFKLKAKPTDHIRNLLRELRMMSDSMRRRKTNEDLGETQGGATVEVESEEAPEKTARKKPYMTCARCDTEAAHMVFSSALNELLCNACIKKAQGNLFEENQNRSLADAVFSSVVVDKQFQPVL